MAKQSACPVLGPVLDETNETPFREALLKDVRRGLGGVNKRIPSKYFYDARGSKLFERICNLPEYYQTRTELDLLEQVAGELTDGFDRGDLIELGSGANWKVRILLNAMGRERRARTRYIALDVSRSAIVEAGKGLLATYPELEVLGFVADFTRHLHWLPDGRPKLMLFFGSTIGNLAETESKLFLDEVRGALGPGDRLVLGLDMVKPVHLLEAAYNDSQEVTAEFNKNVLAVINRELNADFNPDDFEHLAFFNDEEQRVEMYLRANRAVLVTVRDLNMTVTFERGETIHTEICRKFTRSSARKMLSQAGLAIAKWHTDRQNHFALVEVVRADDP